MTGRIVDFDLTPERTGSRVTNMTNTATKTRKLTRAQRIEQAAKVRDRVTTYGVTLLEATAADVTKLECQRFFLAGIVVRIIQISTDGFRAYVQHKTDGKAYQGWIDLTDLQPQPIE